MSAPQQQGNAVNGGTVASLALSYGMAVVGILTCWLGGLGGIFLAGAIVGAVASTGLAASKTVGAITGESCLALDLTLAGLSALSGGMAIGNAVAGGLAAGEAGTAVADAGATAADTTSSALETTGAALDSTKAAADGTKAVAEGSKAALDTTKTLEAGAQSGKALASAAPAEAAAAPAPAARLAEDASYAQTMDYIKQTPYEKIMSSADSVNAVEKGLGHQFASVDSWKFWQTFLTGAGQAGDGALQGVATKLSYDIKNEQKQAEAQSRAESGSTSGKAYRSIYS